MPFCLAHPSHGPQPHPPDYAVLAAFVTVTALFAACGVALTPAQLRDPTATRAAFDTVPAPVRGPDPPDAATVVPATRWPAGTPPPPRVTAASPPASPRSSPSSSSTPPLSRLTPRRTPSRRSATAAPAAPSPAPAERAAPPPAALHTSTRSTPTKLAPCEFPFSPGCFPVPRTTRASVPIRFPIPWTRARVPVCPPVHPRPGRGPACQSVSPCPGRGPEHQSVPPFLHAPDEGPCASPFVHAPDEGPSASPFPPFLHDLRPDADACPHAPPRRGHHRLPRVLRWPGADIPDLGSWPAVHLTARPFRPNQPWNNAASTCVFVSGPLQNPSTTAPAEHLSRVWLMAKTIPCFWTRSSVPVRFSLCPGRGPVCQSVFSMPRTRARVPVQERGDCLLDVPQRTAADEGPSASPSA